MRTCPLISAGQVQVIGTRACIVLPVLTSLSCPQAAGCCTGSTQPLSAHVICCADYMASVHFNLDGEVSGHAGLFKSALCMPSIASCAQVDVQVYMAGYMQNTCALLVAVHCRQWHQLCD